MTDTPTSPPTSATEPTRAHAVLVPGFWLGGWAWQDVEPGLRAAGITPHAVTLPGLDGSPHEGLTLDDHVDAVLGLVEGLDGDVVLVGHSGGGIVVQCVADRSPARFRRVIYVDTGPLLDGMALRPDATDDLPLPSWDELEAEQSSTEGMDDEALATFRARAVAHPGGVAASPIHLHDEARLDVPTTVVCTSLPSAVLGQMIEAGQMPSELPSLRDVRFVDLPTGHWPMFSRPAELADVLRDEILTP
jgi:pimeloyl-ACP methyl ester carboxylesterase